MNPAPHTLTKHEIAHVRGAGVVAGDIELVSVCDRASDGDVEALESVCRWIAEARSRVTVGSWWARDLAEQLGAAVGLDARGGILFLVRDIPAVGPRWELMDSRGDSWTSGVPAPDRADHSGALAAMAKAVLGSTDDEPGGGCDDGRDA